VMSGARIRRQSASRAALRGRREAGNSSARAGRRAALLDRLHGLAQQSPHLDDRLVGRAQMLFAAVDDAPMLSWIARSCTLIRRSGEALGALHRAIDQVVVLPFALERKVVWSTCSGPLPSRARGDPRR